MKVAIDSGPLISGHKVRGIGVHTYELTKKLRKLKSKDLRVDLVDFAKADLSEYDLVHYQNFYPFLPTLPMKVPTKMVVTIHDLIQLVYPRIYQAGFKGRINFVKQKSRIKNADVIITISETSKKDIVRFLGIDSEKIHVIYLAPKNIFKPTTSRQSLITTKRKYKLPERFVLYVGDMNYNKNILGLIKACKIAKLSLVICGKRAFSLEAQENTILSSRPRDRIRYLLGKPHPELAHYEKLLEEFRDKVKILRLGFVPDEDLVTIYNLASVYCQPSFYEGFGVPVLDAMACGVPCVISKTNALVEVAGGAALIADPKNPKDIAEKITKVLKNKKTKELLIGKGLKRAKEFSWEKTAKETLEVYKKLG